jgi:hypothetical protein
LGYAIVVHLLFYIPVTTWGLAALAVYGVDLRAASRSAEAANVAPVAPATTVE